MEQNEIRGGHFKVATQLPKETSNFIVFLRHGESLWNKEKKFTGWSDVSLTQVGIQLSKRAGKILKKHGFEFDLAFTSYLSRAIQTCHYAEEELQQLHIPLIKSWKLNQRHYGALQGLSKVQVIGQHGKQTVLKWRRSYDFPPPVLDKNDERNPCKDRKYRSIPQNQLPRGESLKQAIERVIPYWQGTILPEIASGKKVLLVAHENVLRGIIKILDNISDEDIVDLQIPTATPLVYCFNQKMQKIQHFYLTESQTSPINL